MEKKRPESSDLENVRRAEMSRGRRPVDLETRRQRDEMRRDLKRLLEFATEDEFVAAMRALGLPADSPRFSRTATAFTLSTSVCTYTGAISCLPTPVFR